MKLKEGNLIIYHVNECILIISWMLSFDIKLKDEFQALVLLSFMSECWFGVITTLSCSYRATKLTFAGSQYLMHGKDVCKQNRKYPTVFVYKRYGKKSQQRRWWW